MSIRTLVLGRMPRTARSAPEAYIAAGPWCFVGQEELFPDWEDRFTFGPEPFADHDALEQAACEARCLTARSIAPLAKELRSPELPPLPDVYWETALSAWLVVAAMQVIIYARRAESLVAQWGAEPLRVPVLPADCSFAFATEMDFVLGGTLGHAYTHWLFSRMLEARWPEAWEKVMLPTPPQEELRHGFRPPATWKERLRRKARHALVQVALTMPFPRIKGFSFSQSCKYSWALLQNRNPLDHSTAIADYAVPGEYAAVPELPLDPLPLLRMSMPESVRRARHPHRITPARRKRVRVASILADEDTAYRLRLARWRARGHKLVCIQHGGNYGNVRSTAAIPVTEYCQHAFLSWGWNQQGSMRGNFIPMPHGQLARLRDAHTESSGRLLYVGTEITAFTYRMDSRPTPMQYVQYRDDKQWFFEALPPAIRRVCLYRPYFDVPGTLEDAPWILPRFPDVHLCSGPLDPHMLACRLLVLDHHGTTLALAMAANVPTVLFWDSEAWGLCAQTRAMVDVLAAAGIWHSSAEAAAMHIAAVWDDVGAWWGSPTVQEARRRWRETYARTMDGPIDPVWTATLKTL